eukprot:5232951-Pyramimonas_sp.AAC.1
MANGVWMVAPGVQPPVPVLGGRAGLRRDHPRGDHRGLREAQGAPPYHLPTASLPTPPPLTFHVLLCGSMCYYVLLCVTMCYYVSNPCPKLCPLQLRKALADLDSGLASTTRLLPAAPAC